MKVIKSYMFSNGTQALILDGDISLIEGISKKLKVKIGDIIYDRYYIPHVYKTFAPEEYVVDSISVIEANVNLEGKTIEFLE